jgi:hypothetical protein
MNWGTHSTYPSRYPNELSPKDLPVPRIHVRHSHPPSQELLSRRGSISARSTRYRPVVHVLYRIWVSYPDAPNKVTQNLSKDTQIWVPRRPWQSYSVEYGYVAPDRLKLLNRIRGIQFG